MGAASGEVAPDQVAVDDDVLDIDLEIRKCGVQEADGSA